MAKRISDDKWHSGFIYRLCFKDGEDWIPFYCGESYQPQVREEQHRKGGQSDDDRLVYEAIREMNEAGIEWKMIIWCEYGEEGPEALEDECILSTLAEGWSLTNMKKGNANWMEQKLAEVAEMKALKLTPRQYREHKKAELMKSSGIELEAKVIALGSSRRREENPELVKVRKRTEKWPISRIEEQIEKINQGRDKCSRHAFENKLLPWQKVLAERQEQFL